MARAFQDSEGPGLKISEEGSRPELRTESFSTPTSTPREMGLGFRVQGFRV